MLWDWDGLVDLEREVPGFSSSHVGIRMVAMKSHLPRIACVTIPLSDRAHDVSGCRSDESSQSWFGLQLIMFYLFEKDIHMFIAWWWFIESDRAIVLLKQTSCQIYALTIVISSTIWNISWPSAISRNRSQAEPHLLPLPPRFKSEILIQNKTRQSTLLNPVENRALLRWKCWATWR